MTKTMVKRGQRWMFTTAAGEIREYEVDSIAEKAEIPGRRVRLRRLGGGIEDTFASVFEGWLYQGNRPSAEGRWDFLGEAVSA